MLLEALIIVDSWFNGYLLADKVGIAHLHARHEVIVAARMSYLGTKTEIQSILLDIISGLSSGRKVILHTILTRMSIFGLTQEHPVIFYKITSLCLNTKVQVLTAIITEIETRERRAAILLSTFKLSIGSQAYQKSCCCQN